MRPPIFQPIIGLVRTRILESKNLRAAAILFLSYLAWIGAIRVIFLTLLTYVFRSSQARLQEISEAIVSYEIVVGAFSSLGFALLLLFLHPISTTTRKDLFDPEQFEPRFFPGAVRGASYALGVTTALLLSGYYRFLGLSFFQIDEFVISALIVAGKGLAITLMVYCDEYLFRKKILNHLLSVFPPLPSIVASAGLFAAFKWLQFDLGVMQTFSLFILGILAGLLSKYQEDFTYGAGLSAGILVSFHAILGLSILGCETTGLVLIKFREATLIAANELDAWLPYFLSGGVAGPLASFGLQVLLLAHVARQFLLHRTELLPRKKPL